MAGLGFLVDGRLQCRGGLMLELGEIVIVTPSHSDNALTLLELL